MKTKKPVRKIFAIIGILLALFIAGTVCATAIGVSQNTARAESFDKVEIENQLVPEKDADGNWTFTTDREFKVLQITDVHIGGGWISKAKDEKALNAVAAMITAEKPDLVMVTGDVAYPVPVQSGTFNNKSGAKIFAALMEQLGVYWTVCFGNHDTEAYSYYNREKVSDFYANSGFKYCLYQPGPEDVDGYGNQIINIKNSAGKITQTLFVFDSHSYTDGDIFGIFWKYDNIKQSQVDWYAENVKKLSEQNGSTIPSTAFFHIPLVEQQDAWYEYVENDFNDTEDVKYIYGVAGEGGIIVYPGIGEDNLFETMVELGSTKGTFCGHDHKNNFCVEYKGIQLSYGMSVDYLAYIGIDKEGSQRGCKVITYSPDGSFTSKNESYYQDKYISKYEKEDVTMQEMTNLDVIPE